jgi:hypothetical protein
MPVSFPDEYRRAGAALALGLSLWLAGCAEPPAGPPPSIGSFGDFKPVPGHAHYLACPQNYCLATPDQVTPLRNIAAADLRDLVRRTLDDQPRVHLLATANEGLRLVYRQDGGMFGSSGTVTVEIVDADEGLSGIVLYGQSDAPGGDAAASRRRVRDWLDAIDTAIARAPRR